MRFVLAVILAVHGLIDLLGPSKAFGGTDVTPLKAPIGPRGGLVWLLAGGHLGPDGTLGGHRADPAPFHPAPAPARNEVLDVLIERLP